MPQQITDYAVTKIADAPIDLYILADGSRRIGRRSVLTAMSFYPDWAEKAIKELMLEIIVEGFSGNPPEDATLIHFGILNPLCELESEDLMTTKEFTTALHNVACSRVDMNATPVFNRKNNPEKEVQQKLAKSTGGIAEVKCGAGFIDLLTDDSIIEIKKASLWKSAIGQVLSYGTYYPNHRKVICLFGASKYFDWETVERCCHDLGIEVKRA